MPAAAAVVVSAYMSSQSAKSASRMALAGTREGIAQRERFFQIGREQLAPYVEAGNEALEKIKSIFLEGNMDEFYESPDYQFNLEQGEKALERKQGQKGSRYGGGAIKEALKYAQGNASGEFNNFFNRLKSISDAGQNAAAGVATTANSVGAGIAQMNQQSGVNQGNIALNQGQSMNQAIQGGLSNYTTQQSYNDMMAQINQPTAQPTTQPATDFSGRPIQYN